MNELEQLPNIGSTLSAKLMQVGITNPVQLREKGSINALIQISTLQNHGACINMLYALEGAIQGIRWHGLPKTRKTELLTEFKSLKIS